MPLYDSAGQPLIVHEESVEDVTPIRENTFSWKKIKHVVIAGVGFFSDAYDLVNYFYSIR
jgi:hypothetical protein